MGAQAGSSTSVAGNAVTHDTAALYRQGVLCGIAGAVTIALWFLYLDFTRGRLLYTPTALGTVLFRGGQGLASPETLSPSIAMTLLFTLAHLAVFIVIGIAAVRLLDMFEHRVNVLLAMALLFVIFGLGFLAFAMSFSALPFEVLSLTDVLFGNAMAAVAMGTYLLRQRQRPPAG